MNPRIPLSDFEIETLNKIMHTQAFADYNSVQKVLYSLLHDEKDRLIAGGKAYGDDFRFFQSQTVAHIVDFLKQNEFYGEREGAVFFLTEKGEQLKRLGSLQKYQEWHEQNDAQLIADLHTIEMQGYLPQHQTYLGEPKPVDKKYNTKILWYILILGAIFLLYWCGKRFLAGFTC